MHIRSRWGCTIHGEDVDLNFLHDFLNGSIREPSSFFISMIGESRILRTSVWDEETDPNAVAERAGSDVKILTGLATLYRRTNPFRLGTIVEFKEDGTVLDDHLNSRFTLPGSTRKIEPNLFGRLLYSTDKNIREALFHYSFTGNWVSIYMTFEALSDYFGSDPDLYAAVPHLKQNLILTRRSANRHRHAFNAGDRLSTPIDKSVALRTLNEVFEYIANRLPSRPTTPFTVDGITMENFKVEGGMGLIGLEIGEQKFVDDPHVPLHRS